MLTRSRPHEAASNAANLDGSVARIGELGSPRNRALMPIEQQGEPMADFIPPAKNSASPFDDMRGHHVAVRTPSSAACDPGLAVVP
jgi:hypothetical protein